MSTLMLSLSSKPRPRSSGLTTIASISRLIFVLVVLGQFSEGFGTSTTTTTTKIPTTPRTTTTSSTSINGRQTQSARRRTMLLAEGTRFPSRGGAVSAVATSSSQPRVAFRSHVSSSSSSSSLSSVTTKKKTQTRPVSTAIFASAPGEEAQSTTECPFTKFAATFGGFWGSFGVIYILAKAITRVMPIAVEPFLAESSLVLSPFQWSLYALSCLFFAYAEGYKGFHKKFAPLVVKRSFTLVIGTPQGNNVLNYFLAPLYSMGLWGATKKRRIVSWSITIGVALIVAMVKKLPAAPRCIIDAGVVVGLTIGSLSILYHFLASILKGRLPSVDACLPAVEK